MVHKSVTIYVTAFFVTSPFTSSEGYKCLKMRLISYFYSERIELQSKFLVFV